MRISSVRAFPVGVALTERLRWGAMSIGIKGGVLVIVSTDEGLEGVGEAGFSAEYFSTIGPVINERLAPLLIGEDPLDVGALWQRMFDATHVWGRRGIETYALSGVDLALWDLLGKITNQPVYRLLGATKSRAKTYLAPSLKPESDIVPELEATVLAHGYKAVKLRVGRDARAAVALVEAARKALGDEVDLMVDANMSYNRRTALSVAREFETLGVAWLEEPILCHSLTQYVGEHSWLAERVSLPLAGGESLFTRFEFLDLVEQRPFDILQPDCTTVGGISEAKRIADLASAWNLTCNPHIGCSSGTGIGTAAGLHLVLACSNAEFVEFDAYGGPGWDGLLTTPLVPRDGYLTPTDAPGLGVALNEDGVERFSLSAGDRRA